MQEQDMLKKLKDKCPNQKISCSDARRLAEEWKIDTRELGRLCDEAGIKIYACELGCF